MNCTSSTYISVIYDGMSNSVFKGQVLAPLEALHDKDPTRRIILISFEHTPFPTLSLPYWLNVIILPRLPFIGRIGLYITQRKLRKHLARVENYVLQARGPLAGYLCLRARTHGCRQFTIQARGLLAEEYTYTHRYETRWFKRIVHTFRTWQFFMLEKKVYSNNHQPTITIEAVSPALRDYLIRTFDSNPVQITIASHDIPATLCQEQRTVWRAAIRTQLDINDTTTIFCYNGSYKPWQCPDAVIATFKEYYQHNPQSFLLILTTDKDAFVNHLKQSTLDVRTYAVITVDYHDIYRYLSACDVGLMFREHTLLNWVSRPTKMLEYQAVGLTIKHNDSIAWLVEHQNNLQNNNLF